jgi:DNA replication protein DnaC
MFIEPTINKLQAMRLNGMAEAWREQQKDVNIAKLSFEERFSLLVDTEYLARENKKLSNRMKEAKLRITQACIEDLEYSKDRNIEMAQIHQLATCGWVKERLHIIITGATGVGKTYLACALAQQACRRGYRSIYRRVSRLFDELTLARADGSLPKLLLRFSRADVLVLDDWCMTPMQERNRLDLLEILEDRDGLKSTIITSQLPSDKWHDQIGDPTVADAILDRIVHRAHTVALEGKSRRKEKGGKK